MVARAAVKETLRAQCLVESNARKNNNTALEVVNTVETSR